MSDPGHHDDNDETTDTKTDGYDNKIQSDAEVERETKERFDRDIGDSHGSMEMQMTELKYAMAEGGALEMPSFSALVDNIRSITLPQPESEQVITSSPDPEVQRGNDIALQTQRDTDTQTEATLTHYKEVDPAHWEAVKDRNLQRWLGAIGFAGTLAGLGIALAALIREALHKDPDAPETEWSHNKEVAEWVSKYIQDWLAGPGTDEKYWKGLADAIDKANPKYTIDDEIMFCSNTILIFDSAADPVFDFPVDDKETEIKSLLLVYRSQGRISEMFRAVTNAVSIGDPKDPTKKNPTLLPKPSAAGVLRQALQRIKDALQPHNLSAAASPSPSCADPFHPTLISSVKAQVRKLNQLNHHDHDCDHHHHHQAHHHHHHHHTNGHTLNGHFHVSEAQPDSEAQTVDGVKASTRQLLGNGAFDLGTKITSGMARVAASLSWATPYGPFVSAGVDALTMLFGFTSSGASLADVVREVLNGVQQIMNQERVKTCVYTVQSCMDWYATTVGAEPLTITNMEKLLHQPHGLQSMLSPSGDSLYEAVHTLGRVLGFFDDQPDAGPRNPPDNVGADEVAVFMLSASFLLLVRKQLCLLSGVLVGLYKSVDENKSLEYMDEFHFHYNEWKADTTWMSRKVKPWCENIIKLRKAGLDAKVWGGPWPFYNPTSINFWTSPAYPPYDGSPGVHHPYIRFEFFDSWGLKNLLPTLADWPARPETDGEDWNKERDHFEDLKHGYINWVNDRERETVTAWLDSVGEWEKGPGGWAHFLPPDSPAETSVVTWGGTTDESATGTGTADTDRRWLPSTDTSPNAVWAPGNQLTYSFRYANDKGLSGISQGSAPLAVPPSSKYPLLLIPADPTGTATHVTLYRFVTRETGPASQTLKIANITIPKDQQGPIHYRDQYDRI